MKRLFALLIAVSSMPSYSQILPATDEAISQSYENAEKRIRAKLESSPDNSDLRLLLIRSLIQQKKYDAAIVEYRPLRLSEPHNVDYVVAVAMLHVSRGAPLEALPELDRARSMAPDHEDIWKAEVNALDAAGSDTHNRQAQDLRQQAAVRFPNSTWMNASTQIVSKGLKREPENGAPQKITDLTRRTTIEISASTDRLSNGSGDWKGTGLQMTHRIADQHLISAGLRDTRRFGLSDTQVEASYSAPLTARLIGTLDGTFSTSHHVLPKNSLGAILQYEVMPAWFVHGGIKNTQYDNASVNQGTLLLEHYFSSYRWAAAWRPTRALGTTAHSADFRFDYIYSDLSSVGVTLSAGRDVATVEGPTVIVSDVRAITVNGRHWFNREWALHYEVGGTRQGDAYSKNGVLLGVEYAF